jgi:hypothetical protein
MENTNVTIEFISKQPEGSVNLTGFQSSIGRPVAIVDLDFLLSLTNKVYTPANFESIRSQVVRKIRSTHNLERLHSEMWNTLVELDTVDQISRLEEYQVHQAEAHDEMQQSM